MKYEHGTITYNDPGSDKHQGRYATTQCVHCGGHFTIRPGSGTTRGFCMNCGGITCGQPDCRDCLHWEAKLEIAEGTRNPTAVSSAVPQGKIWTPGDP